MEQVHEVDISQTRSVITRRPVLKKDRFAGLKLSDLSDTEKESVMKLALKALAVKHRAGRSLGNPKETREYLCLIMADYRREVFGCIFLDNRHRIIGMRELFHGSVHSASVHPRVVVQEALEVNAAACVAYHNHPSGVPEPSEADRHLTRKLQDALSLVEVNLIDHFVIGSNESVSFAERGLL